MESNPFFGGLTVRLCGKAFKAGKGVQDRQIVEFAESVPLHDDRLDYDTRAPFLLRYFSFRRGSGERGHPVAPYVDPDDPDKSPGYCCAAMPTSLDELHAFIARNRAIPNINVGFECIAGEPDVLDLASCVAFDLDVKNTGKKKTHPTVLAKFRSLGWELPEASLFDKDAFLDYVLPRISSFLTELFELRGTALDPPLTLRDFYVGDACKPYVEEQRESIVHSGILSFHVKVPRLMFRNQADRNVFKRACIAKLSRDLLATVDTTVYNKNRNMRLLCHQKFGGKPLMPYSRNGMYGDDREYADPADVPASVVLNHTWSFVPPESQRLFTDGTAQAFASQERSHPKPLCGTGTRRGVVASDDAHVDDARIDPTVAVYETFCTAMKLPFSRSDDDFSLKESDNDGVDYEIYLKQRAGVPRTCPVGAVHTSNQAKLVVRRGAVHYVCFSKPRGGGAVRTAPVGDAPGVEYDVLRSAYRKLCCEMFVGDLPYTLFEIPTDLIRTPRVDANGVRREANIGQKMAEKMKDIVAHKCPTVFVKSFESGK
jgi:hypothetical protein